MSRAYKPLDFGDVGPFPSSASLVLAESFISCDDVYPDGSEKPPNVTRASYSYAQKMRAALTYGFGRIGKCGNTPWFLSDKGEWRGNPSISEKVSNYMVSLRKRKVWQFTNLRFLIIIQLPSGSQWRNDDEF
jgi:hypothetical protein